jgi:hypothetical protein
VKFNNRKVTQQKKEKRFSSTPEAILGMIPCASEALRFLWKNCMNVSLVSSLENKIKVFHSTQWPLRQQYTI